MANKLNLNREMVKKGDMTMPSQMSHSMHQMNPEREAPKPAMRGKYLNHVDEVADII